MKTFHFRSNQQQQQQWNDHNWISNINLIIIKINRMIIIMERRRKKTKNIDSMKSDCIFSDCLFVQNLNGEKTARKQEIHIRIQSISKTWKFIIKWDRFFSYFFTGKKKGGTFCTFKHYQAIKIIEISYSNNNKMNLFLWIWISLHFDC